MKIEFGEKGPFAMKEDIQMMYHKRDRVGGRRISKKIQAINHVCPLPAAPPASPPAPPGPPGPPPGPIRFLALYDDYWLDVLVSILTHRKVTYISAILGSANKPLKSGILRAPPAPGPSPSSPPTESSISLRRGLFIMFCIRAGLLMRF